MGCLFILYKHLVPHLHELKIDVFSCHTKKKLLGVCSSLSPWKGVFV